MIVELRTGDSVTICYKEKCITITSSMFEE